MLTLTLNRPEARNALSTECLELLVQHLETADRNESIGAVVITGSEHCFAAGADLRELQQQTVASAIIDQRPLVWQRFNTINKPIIAAVNGYALGAGCELALACDIVICGENARFGLPEITLGLIPGAGGTQRLLRSVGKSLASQMVLTGEAINAQQAMDSKLVSEICVTELTLERAQQIAIRISQQSPLALRAAKSALRAAQETTLTQGLNLERQLFVSLSGTEDRAEGIAAFLQNVHQNLKDASPMTSSIEIENMVLTHIEAGVLTITLNRPDRLNSFNDEMHGQLSAALKMAERDENVRCVLLTGAGRGFCAGQDLNDRNVSVEQAAPDLGLSVERFITR